ncbi:MAG: MarR family transcriptional regulator [Acidobacteria bacterium]|nr:MarR family transcriptional regulator [Acidobacteriota bacterium]
MRSALQAELKQTCPFPSAETEAMLSIARTAALLDHALAQAVKPASITPTQYNVLRILRGAGADGLCRSAIGARMVTSVPDVTRLLDRMEAAGLIRRSRGTDDRRFVTTVITSDRLRLLETLDAPVEALNRRQLSHLGRPALRVLIDTLALARARA